MPESTSSDLYTETITQVTTVTKVGETSTPSALSLRDTAGRSSFYIMQRGSIRTPPSLPLPTTTSPHEVATPSSPAPSSSEQSTSMTAPKRSTYPRPSPPGFLYPDPIVPAAASAMSQRDSQSTMSDKDGAGYLSCSTGFVIYVVIMIGVTWAGLSLLNISWFARRRAKERRPLDKPSKYAHRQQSSGEHTSSQNPILYVDDNTHVTEEIGGIEMRYRPRRRSQGRTSRTYERLDRPRPISTVGARSTATYTPSYPSPPNPFLAPSGHLRHRNVELRASSSPSLHSLHPPLHASSTSTSPYDLATSEIEALEAGTAPLTPRTITTHERKKSWVDLGRTTVEDTVNGMVNRAMRWTDGDDEGVLLPVSNGDRREVEGR